MRTRVLQVLLIVAAGPLLAACSDEVVVQVLQETEDGAAGPAADLPLSFLPYDRDSVFEVLAERHGEPEPEMPPELEETSAEIIERQRAWREAEQAWTDARNELQDLSNQLEGMDTRGREYLELFQQFEEREQQVDALEAQRDEAFTAFDTLQQQTIERIDSARAVISSWEDDAFRDYPDITDSLLEASGREIHEDTTDADGTATAQLNGGPWWVHARQALPFEELYWNVPFDPGETDTVRLDRDNAEIRIRM